MRSALVAISPPVLNPLADLGQMEELRGIQAFGPQAAVKRLNAGIMRHVGAGAPFAWEPWLAKLGDPAAHRVVRALSYRKLSVRPHHHAKSDAAVAAFKKISPRVWRKSRPTMLTASR